MKEMFAESFMFSSSLALQNQYVVFYTSIMLESAFASAASTFTSRILSEASSATGGFNFTAFSTSVAPQPPTSSVNSTSLLTQPFSRSTFNLRPFDQLAGVSATTGESHLTPICFLLSFRLIAHALFLSLFSLPL